MNVMPSAPAAPRSARSRHICSGKASSRASVEQARSRRARSCGHSSPRIRRTVTFNGLRSARDDRFVTFAGGNPAAATPSAGAGGILIPDRTALAEGIRRPGKILEDQRNDLENHRIPSTFEQIRETGAEETARTTQIFYPDFAKNRDSSEISPRSRRFARPR